MFLIQSYFPVQNFALVSFFLYQNIFSCGNNNNNTMFWFFVSILYGEYVMQVYVFFYYQELHQIWINWQNKKIQNKINKTNQLCRCWNYKGLLVNGLDLFILFLKILIRLLTLDRSGYLLSMKNRIFNIKCSILIEVQYSGRILIYKQSTY